MPRAPYGFDYEVDLGFLHYLEFISDPVDQRIIGAVHRYKTDGAGSTPTSWGEDLLQWARTRQQEELAETPLLVPLAPLPLDQITIDGLIACDGAMPGYIAGAKWYPQDLVPYSFPVKGLLPQEVISLDGPSDTPEPAPSGVVSDVPLPLPPESRAPVEEASIPAPEVPPAAPVEPFPPGPFLDA